jgi:two-component system response regulator HydG
VRSTPRNSLLGSAFLLYLVADAAAAQGELDLAGAVIAVLAGALSLSAMRLRHAEISGRERVSWLGLLAGCALVRVAAPFGLSLVVDVAHVLGVAGSGALLFDLALFTPDHVGSVRRHKRARLLGHTLCVLCALAGLAAHAPPIVLFGAVWLPPPLLAYAPFAALVMALCAALIWRLLRSRLGSTPEALASNAWAVLGLLPATLLAVLLAVGFVLGAGPWSPIVRVATALAASVLLVGHLRMLDPARRLSAAPVTREAAAGALTILLVAAGGVGLGGLWPSTPLASGTAACALLLCAALLWNALRRLSQIVLAPVSGRLLLALDEAHIALAEASTLDDVARVVLGAARLAAGDTEAQPLLQLFEPRLQLCIDAAGQPHATELALHPEIERALRDAPGEIIARAPLEAQIVRAPALRPLIDALCTLDALCVLPLSQDSELEAALLFPRAQRDARLTLEELQALRGFGRHVTGFLSVLASDARAQRRASIAFAEAERAGHARAEAEHALLRASAEARALREGGSAERLTMPLVAYGPAMRAFVARLRAVASSEVPVVLLAERGVPVAMLARLLHDEGGHRQQPFVMGECAALRPEDCKASLLGSHERGSPGWLELAAHGTLLLCDLPALGLDAQQALAEALQRRHAQPIDSDQPYACDARLVLSSRVDPDVLLARGALHPALRERLPLCLRVPPLRERAEDLPSILLFALDHSARRLGRPTVGLDDAAQARLLAHPWPGNFEELAAVIEHAVTRCRGSRATLDDLPQLGPLPDGSDAWLDGTLEQVERRVLQRALERALGNKSEAARLLGLKRSTFFDKLRRHGLEADDKDSQAPN